MEVLLVPLVRAVRVGSGSCLHFKLQNEMDVVKLSLALSFMFPLSLGGDPSLQGAKIGSKGYPVQQPTTSNAVSNDRPYPYRKRSKKLKFHKFLCVKLCLNKECNNFKLLTRKSLIYRYRDQLMSDSSKPELPINLAVGCFHQFGFKERKVKKNSVGVDLMQPTDRRRFNNIPSYFSNEVQATVPKYRKHNRPVWQYQVEVEQSGTHHTTHHSSISRENPFVKFVPSQVLNNHPSHVRKRNVETNADKIENEDAEVTSATVKTKTTKPGTVVCPTLDSDSGKKGNESRMPYDWDRDSYMALGSLTFLLLVLTCAVMYTGLWKKRNTMLYPDFIDRENSSSRYKTDIKALLKAKLGKIPIRRNKIRAKTRNHRNHHRNYHELPLVEDMEVESGSGPDSEEKSSDEEEEIFSNGKRNGKTSAYY